MSTPSPFEIGRAVGGNVSGAIRGAGETSAIDQILQQANESGDEQDVQNAMNMILQRVSPERQQAAVQILQTKQQQLARQKQAQAYQEQGLNPNLPESINKELVKKRGEGGDKQRAYQNSLNLLGRAKQIAGSGHLGPKIGILGTGRDWGSTTSSEGQRLRAEYKQIGKALVQAAAPLKITNRTEFQHYAEDLEDPTRTLEEIQGTLATLERIVRNSMGEEQEFGDQKAQSTMQTSQQAAKAPTEKPPLTSFYR